MYPRARTQTKTAEKWISQQEGRLDPRQKAATEEIRQAMEDESASWLRRSSAVGGAGAGGAVGALARFNSALALVFGPRLCGMA